MDKSTRLMWAADVISSSLLLYHYGRSLTAFLGLGIARYRMSSLDA